MRESAARSVAVSIVSVLACATSVTVAGAAPRTTASACPPKRLPVTAFVDIAGDVHAGSIRCIVWWGVAVGTSATTFSPERVLTRAQLASFLARVVRVTGAELPSQPADAFADDDGSVHEGNIDVLAGMGILAVDGDRIGPDQPASRELMADVLVRTYEAVTGTSLPVGPDAFTDDAASPYRASIDKAAAAGFTAGVTPSTFEPMRSLPRDPMRSFVARVLDKLVEDGFAEPPAGAVERWPGTGGAEEPASAPEPGNAVGADPASAGDGSRAIAPPTNAPDDVVIHPLAAGSGGDVASIPAPEAGLPTGDSSQSSPMPVTDWGRGSRGPGSVEASFLYDGQQVFPYSGAGYLTYEALPRSVGRIEMFTGDKADGSCSATVVARDFVLTAAHCVKGHDCYRFWPDLYGTQARYGHRDSCRGWYPTAYDTAEPWRVVLDYTLIRLEPNATGSVGDVVGTQQVLMDTGGINLAKYNMGYPNEGFFAERCRDRSCTPWYCWAPDGGRYDWGNGWTSMGWGCDANGGISGGPVFAQYRGRWYVVSVNSSGGIIVPCTSACPSRRNFWYLRNMWGPVLRSGAFDVFWNEVWWTAEVDGPSTAGGERGTVRSL